MTDRTEDQAQPARRGPWHDGTEPGRYFDRGAPWCLNAAGHPSGQNTYPDATIHTPPDECQTRSLFTEGLEDLAGPSCFVETYAAEPFRYGQPRTGDLAATPRVIIETHYLAADTSTRFSVSLGDALRLATHLAIIVSTIDRAGFDATSFPSSR